MSAAQVDLSALISADNTSRKAAEAALDALQESQPYLLAMQLVTTLAQPGDPTHRTVCAVLLRRRLPLVLSKLTGDMRGTLKAGLLVALSSECDDSLRRKICDTVGRIAAELQSVPDNVARSTGCQNEGWPELMTFIQAACAAGEPKAHAAAISVLSHMAPALVEPTFWAASGAGLQGLLLAALAPGTPPPVMLGALAALASLLSATADAENDAQDRAERKQYKAVAGSLQGALPAMLGVLEQAINSAQPEQIETVLASLSEVAASQPKLFKAVLPQVVEGMAQLAGRGDFTPAARMQCAELLLTLAEGASTLCGKYPNFAARVLGVLVPMLMRLPEDTSEWRAAEPDDGLRESDEEDEAEKESIYAQEALERLCAALGGEEVVALLLPQLQSMLAPDAPWAARHAALIAIGQVAEHGPSTLEPHLAILASLLSACAAAPEPRLRWASIYCVGLLCDQFEALGETMHATLMPLLLATVTDAQPRVQAAANLAVVNLSGSMLEEDLLRYSQPLLTRIHATLSSDAAPLYVAYTSASALGAICSGLSDAPSRPLGSAYGVLMPLLTARLGPAMAAHSNKLASAVLAAIGHLATAAGAEHVAADAGSLVTGVAGLLAAKEVSEDRDLMRAVHTTLSCIAGVVGADFVPSFTALLPQLLASASQEVEVHLDKVEVEDQDEEAGWEVMYMANKGKGLIRLRVNASQMDEKLLALDALYSYAAALGADFFAAVPQITAVCTPLLTYRYSDKARAAAVSALGEAYKCVVLAIQAGAAGAPASLAADYVGGVLKPLSDAIGKEDSLTAADAMLDAVHDMLVLERTHKAGALGANALSTLLQLLKRELQKDEKRRVARAEEAAEEGDDAETDEEQEEEAQELLSTLSLLVCELLRQHGAAAMGQIETQLLPHVQAWMGAEDAHRLALGIEIFGAAIEFGGAAAGKKYVSAVLPLLAQHVTSAEPKLRRAAAYGLGVVAEFGGKLLSRSAASAVAGQLGAVLADPTARYSANVWASEAAVAALGKMLVHRSAAVDGASALPAWLPWLPLRHSAEDAAAAMGSLCKLLEADSAAVLGEGSANFPMVLGAMTAAYEAEATGEEVSARLKSLVQAWSLSNGAMLTACVDVLPQPHLKEKAGRMAAA